MIYRRSLKHFLNIVLFAPTLVLSVPSIAGLVTYEWVTVTNPSLAPVTAGGFRTTYEFIGTTTGTLQIEDSLAARSYSFDSRLPPFTNLTTFATPRSAVSSIYSLSFTANYNVFRSDTNALGDTVRTFAGDQAALATLAPLNIAASSDFAFSNYFPSVGAFTRFAIGNLTIAADNTLSLSGRIGESVGSEPVFAEFSSSSGYTEIVSGSGPSLNDGSPTGLSGFWRLVGTTAIPGGIVNPVSTPSSSALLGLGIFCAIRSRRIRP